MEPAVLNVSAEINYSLSNKSVSTSRNSFHSAGEETTATGSSGSDRFFNSDTLFDQSSTDGTVVPYMVGGRASREFLSSASIGTFDPEASPKSHLSRVTSRRSIDTDLCGTLYEETVQVDMDISPASSSDRQEVEECHESQRLVNDNNAVQESEQPASQRKEKADYRVGSCYHCLINVPTGSLTAWILLFLFSIGWATTTWLGVDKGKDLLRWPETETPLSYDDTALIAVPIATVVIASVFLIVATFSSQKMSRYSFTSSKKNKFGYCLSITVIVLTFLCVIFWTGIIGLTMVPVSVLSLVHVLVGGNALECLHLPSYGVGAMSNVTTTMGSVDNTFLCGSDLESWMETAWRALVPLLISLGFAVAIEGCMMGFMVAASCNARHLRERMAYINEPYSYSSENINGNAKSGGQDKPVTNNNQSDTQI